MSTPSDSQTFVPFTARMMAAIRAQESERSDRLFNDPFAGQLAGEEAIAAVQERLAPQDLTYVAVRTRFFDDWIQSHVSDIPQVVMLASGMDTRAYRLDWLDTVHVYELDQPSVLDYKAAMLAEISPQCEHHLIRADLTQPWRDRLLDQGFQINEPSLWLVEGLLMYLTEADVRQVLATVTDCACPGSVLGLDLINPASMNYAAYQGYFKSGFESPDALLAEYSWRATVYQPNDDAVSYGRYLFPLPSHSGSDVQRVFLVTATQESK